MPIDCKGQTGDIKEQGEFVQESQKKNTAVYLRRKVAYTYI